VNLRRIDAVLAVASAGQHWDVQHRWGGDTRVGPKGKQTVKPPFSIGQKVRVVQMIDWPEDTRNVVGAEGEIVGISPNESKTGWEMSVFLDGLQESWGFNPAELELCDSDAPVQKLAPLLIELTFRSTVDLPAKVANVREAVQRLIGPAEVEWDRPPNRSEPVAMLRLWPSRDVCDALETMVASTPEGWLTIFDDGWAVEAHWDSVSTDFLSPDVERAVVLLRPWDEPSRRELRLDQH
jgi:hypothetical protein